MKIDNASNKLIVNDIGSVQFPCPSCLKGNIVRSKNSRQIVAPYTCPACGFVGPN